MAINLQNAARYIHGQSPSKLDGLYHAVAAKCQELNLTPGRRDNVGVGKDHSGAVSGNIRGLLTFVEGVQPLPDPLPDDADAVAADAPAATDTVDELLAKKQRADQRAARKAAHDRATEQIQADQAALRKLLGTLQAKFAAAGYSPRAAGGALA